MPGGERTKSGHLTPYSSWCPGESGWIPGGLLPSDRAMRPVLHRVRNWPKHFQETIKRPSACDRCDSFIYTLNELIWNERHPGLRKQITFSRDRGCEICSHIREALGRACHVHDFGETQAFRLESIEHMMGLGVYVLISADDHDLKLYLLPLDVPTGEPPGRVLGPQVDAELIRTWLHCCETWHGSLCAGGAHDALQDVDFLRVIDVRQNFLVRVASSASYVALSYVWGQAKTLRTIKDNVEALERDGALLQGVRDLPQTIRDAIAFVYGIGERFLWVDALCIVQDDGIGKMQLVNQMDKIYKNALVTLVCAAGRDADAGLPGVNTPRKTQQIVRYGDGRRLAVSHAPFADQEATCVWNRRAWTHQEGLLSGRKLVFLEEGVHFNCQKMTWSEDVRAEERSIERHFQMYDFNGVSDNDRFMRSDKILQPRKKGEYTLLTSRTLPNFLDYCDLVCSHLKRQLTFEDDVLNSFQGILNHWSPQFGSFRMGLPKFYFSLALLWEPRDYCRPRRRFSSSSSPGGTNFASWSWAAWVCELDIEHWKAACDFTVHDDLERAYKTVPTINFDGATAHESSYDQWCTYRRDTYEEQREQDLPDGWLEQEIKPRYYLGRQVYFEYRFHRSTGDFFYPIPFPIGDGPGALGDTHASELSFCAEIAVFTVSVQSSYPHRSNALSIVNRAKEWCGIAILHEPLEEDTDLEFVGISSGEVFTGSIDQRVFPEIEHVHHLGAPELYRYQNVILTKAGHNGRRYSRVGIGRIRQDQWDSAELQLQPLILE